MKNSRFAHRYVPPAVFVSVSLFVLNFVPSYDLDKLNEQFELANNMYEEYKKLIDELRDMKMKYKILICDMRKESI